MQEPLFKKGQLLLGPHSRFVLILDIVREENNIGYYKFLYSDMSIGETSILYADKYYKLLSPQGTTK